MATSSVYSKSHCNKIIFPFSSPQPENTPPLTPQAEALIGLAVPGLQYRTSVGHKNELT